MKDNELIKCRNCKRIIITKFAERGCATHGLERQIKEIYPFLTVSSLGEIRHKGEVILRYEINWIQHEDMI